jgi:beta-glucanase (GH16 family)
VANGKLQLTAWNEKLSDAPDFGGQAYTSARLFTRGKSEFTYGFVEVRAKLPCGLGTWPVIWMLGTQGEWPEEGEIDIMEHVGRSKGEVLGSLHTGAYNWPNKTQITAKRILPAKNANHHQWPFDDPQYLILNLAIGGFLGGPVDDNIFPVTMEVDYVRVYQKPVKAASRRQ